MKTTITSAIFILVFSVASVTTMQAQSVKTTDSSLRAGDNTAIRITTSRLIKDSTVDQIFDHIVIQQATAAAKRIQRASSEIQHQDSSTRQKPVRTESNLDQTSSSQQHDSTKYNAGMVDAQ